MVWPLWPKSEIEYHNTSQGILTESGIWYRTTVDLLDEYAGELFEREALGVHLARSDTWIRSPHTLSLWLLALGLMVYNPWQLAIAVPGFFLIWQIIAPALVNRSLSPYLRLLDAALLQAILYATIMSVLAMSGQYLAVAVGLVGFVCIRWGVLTYLMRPFVARCWKSFYKLPASDHVLRAFMIRSALRYGINLTEFKKIEQSIIANILKKKMSRGRVMDD